MAIKQYTRQEINKFTSFLLRSHAAEDWTAAEIIGQLLTRIDELETENHMLTHDSEFGKKVIEELQAKVGAEPSETGRGRC